jgi:predicted DCC family thiol-disulfide oxidoreductase YuxK
MATAPAAEAKAADPARGKGVVLYDGLCPLCQRSVRVLKRLDWRHKLHFQDCRDTANLPASAVPLELKTMLEEMHVVTPDRQRAYAGFAAFRWIAWRIPVTMPLTPLLYLPGVPWLGRKVYLWVAKNRYNLVPCKDGVCELPKRK